MRANELKKIMKPNKSLLLVAETSMNGVFLIKAKEITNETPARVFGKVLKIIKTGENGERKDLIGNIVDFGIRNVRQFNSEEDRSCIICNRNETCAGNDSGIYPCPDYKGW